MMILFAIVSILDYSIGMEANLAYDNNIFSYSQKYLEDFLSGSDPARFPFETYDDLITAYDFDIALRTKIIPRRTSTFRLRMKASCFFHNPQKDYQVFAGSIRQSFGRLTARFEYLFLPGFLVKYYRDPGGSDYVACKFAEHLYTLKTTYAPGEKLLVWFRVAQETDDYVEAFDVYDSKAIRAGAGLNAFVGNTFEPVLDYEMKDMNAQGPVPDISYVQHRADLTGLVRLRVPRLTRLWFIYGIRYRLYTTELSPLEDTPHSGRQDLVHSFTIGLCFPLFTRLYWSNEYNRQISSSFSEIYTDISEYKDYDKWTLSGGIRFDY